MVQPARRNRANAAERARQAAQAVVLRRSGATLRTIAEELDVPLKTAQRRLDDGYAAEWGTGERPSTLRSETEDRLASLLQRAWRHLEDPEIPPAAELRWSQMALKIERERVRLLGLAVPSTVVVRSEINAGPDLDEGGDGADPI